MVKRGSTKISAFADSNALAIAFSFSSSRVYRLFKRPFKVADTRSSLTLKSASAAVLSFSD